MRHSSAWAAAWTPVFAQQVPHAGRGHEHLALQLPQPRVSGQ